MKMENKNGRVLLEHTDTYLSCHYDWQCKGEYCTMHNRSDHHMRSFPQYWRSDMGFMERTCPHGIGHPDPDEIAKRPGHGCDGCCFKEE